MITINVKKITENDRLSPIGGEKLAKKLVQDYKKNSNVEIDFDQSGSHSSLFFNAFYGYLFKNEYADIIENIKIINFSKLDVDTSRRCKENSFNHYNNSEYRDSVENLKYEGEE